MLKTLSGLTDKAFFGASADTKRAACPPLAGFSTAPNPGPPPIMNIIPNFAYFFNENLII